MAARRMRRVQLGVAVGVVLLLGVVLALVLLRDDAGGSPPPQTIPTPADMDKLRAEAAAAAENLVRTIDQADATGNPELLDGLYTEGAASIADGQKKFIRDRTAQGLVSVKRSRITDVRVEEVTPSTATVRLVHTVISGELRDRKTGRLVERKPASVTPLLLGLERIDGRWLVSAVTITDHE
jgi:hypothetical protein